MSLDFWKGVGVCIALLLCVWGVNSLVKHTNYMRNLERQVRSLKEDRDNLENGNETLKKVILLQAKDLGRGEDITVDQAISWYNIDQYK